MAIPIKFVKQQEFVLKVRRDVERIWIARDPVLSQGEIGYDISNNAIKIGNGVNSWTNLPYVSAQATDIDGRIELASHIGNFINPHNVTKDQVGLGLVDNTSDINKPISLAQQAVLDTKVNNSQVLTNVPLNALFTDTTYTIGDGQLSEKNFTIALFDKLNSITAIFTTALKGLYDTASDWVIANGTNVLNHLSSTSNPHSVTKSQIGLSNVDNTSDIAKPISTATQTSLDNKVNNSQVLTNVPAGAVFTDTTYDNTDFATAAQGVLADNSVQKTGQTVQTVEGGIIIKDPDNNFINILSSKMQNSVLLVTELPPNITTAKDSVYIGFYAGFGIVSGLNNVGIGRQALGFNKIGSSNTGVGHQSLWYNNSKNNTAFGTQTLFALNNQSDSEVNDFNTALGYQAGIELAGGLGTRLYRSNKSVFLGALSRALQDNSLNEIVIGYSAIGNGDNTVTIGNDNITDTYLKGNVRGTNFIGSGAGLTGVASSAQGDLASNSVQKTGETSQSIEGKLGLGNTSPAVKLDIQGTTDELMRLSQSAATNAPLLRMSYTTTGGGAPMLVLENNGARKFADFGDKFSFNQSGVLSVNTSNTALGAADDKLYVEGGASIKGRLKGLTGIDEIVSTNDNENTLTLSYGIASNKNALKISQPNAGGTGLAAGAIINVDSNSANPRLYLHNNEANPVIVNTTGKLGVGITNPTEKIETDGNVKATNFIGSGAGLTNVVQKTGETSQDIEGGVKVLGELELRDRVVHYDDDSNHRAEHSVGFNADNFVYTLKIGKQPTGVTTPYYERWFNGIGYIDIIVDFSGDLIVDGNTYYHTGNLASSPQGVKADNSVQKTGETFQTIEGEVSIEAVTGTASAVVKSRDGNAILKIEDGLGRNTIFQRRSNTGDDFRILQNGSTVAILTADGSLGLKGGATPTEKLDVEGNVKATNFIGSGAGLTEVVQKNLATNQAQQIQGSTTFKANGSVPVTLYREGATTTVLQGFKADNGSTRYIGVDVVAGRFGVGNTPNLIGAYPFYVDTTTGRIQVTGGNSDNWNNAVLKKVKVKQSSLVTSYSFTQANNETAPLFTAGSNVSAVFVAGLTIGTTFEFAKFGDGNIVLSGASGVTLRVPTGEVAEIEDQYAIVTAEVVDTNEILLTGRLKLA